MRNIDYYRNSKGEIWLNVASSSDVLKDFVNLDNNIFLHYTKALTRCKRIIPRKYWETIDRFSEAKKQALLIRHDCRKPLFFPDNSVDHILCSHFLEHVFPVEMEKIVKDFYRVIKSKGTLHVVIPDLKILTEQYLTKNRNGEPLAADDFIKGIYLGRESRGSFKYRWLEFLGAFGLQHRWMYDLSSMEKKLHDAGFKILGKNETPSKRWRLDEAYGNSVHVVACKQ